MANTFVIDLESTSSQHLSRADEALISITGNLTIELWVQFESLPTAGNEMSFVAKRVAGGNRSYIFHQVNVAGTQKLELGISSNGTAQSTASVNWTPTAGVYAHVAVVYTAAAGTADFYVNGVLQGTQQSGLPTSIFDGTSLLSIGADTDGGAAANFYDGKIDDVRLWATTRTAAQILANYLTEIDTAASLIGSWHLNNALTDSSGNSLTLTNNNTATFSSQVPFFEGLDIAGAPTESVLMENSFSVTDIAGVPSEVASARYGFGKQTKSATPSWSLRPKS